MVLAYYLLHKFLNHKASGVCIYYLALAECSFKFCRTYIFLGPLASCIINFHIKHTYMLGSWIFCASFIHKLLTCISTRVGQHFCSPSSWLHTHTHTCTITHINAPLGPELSLFLLHCCICLRFQQHTLARNLVFFLTFAPILFFNLDVCVCWR